MAVPISVRREKYIKELRVLMTTALAQNNTNISTPKRRIAMMRLFRFLNTNGLRIFGFSGSEGKFIKTMLTKADSLSVDLNEEIAAGEVSKRVLILDKKLLILLETCKQKINAHMDGVP